MADRNRISATLNGGQQLFLLLIKAIAMEKLWSPKKIVADKKKLKFFFIKTVRKKKVVIRNF